MNKFGKKKNKGKKKNGKSNQSEVMTSAVSTKFYDPNVAQRMSQTRRSPPLRLTSCALRFAAAIADPFGIASQGACIPTNPAINSQKVHSFSRFDAVVGTNGLGFVTIHPCLGSDALISYVTGVTFAGVNGTCLTANNTLVTGVSRQLATNLPYTTNNILASDSVHVGVAAGRIVSVGVRMWYTGTTLNESGLTYCYVSPSHEPANVQTANVSLAMTTGTLANFEQTVISPLTRNECCMTIFPISRNEMEYYQFVNDASLGTNDTVTQAVYPFSCGYSNQGNNFTDSVASINAGSAPAIIMFTGYAGNTVHVEIIQHVEYIGVATAGRTTKDVSDEEGAGHVIAAALIMQENATANAGKVKQPGMWSMMYDALKVVAGSATKMLVPAAEKALAALLV